MVEKWNKGIFDYWENGRMEWGKIGKMDYWNNKLSIFAILLL